MSFALVEADDRQLAVFEVLSALTMLVEAPPSPHTADGK
jgi:hypothetical protein